MVFMPHGENGITFTLLAELHRDNDVEKLLTTARWSPATKRKLVEAKVLAVHLFPSFGRRDGLGEPDAIILTDKGIIYVEVETEVVRRLPKHFFKQLGNFMTLGGFFRKSERRKVGGKPLEDELLGGRRFKGLHRTRRLVRDLLALQDKSDFYLVINDDHPEVQGQSGEDPRPTRDALVGRIEAEVEGDPPLERVGWLGFPSIKRMEISAETIKVINDNLQR